MFFKRIFVQFSQVLMSELHNLGSPTLCTVPWCPVKSLLFPPSSAHYAQLFQYPSLSTYFRHRKWFLLCSPYQLKMSSTFVTFNNLLYIILPNDLQRGVISVHINDNFSFDSFNHNFYSQVSFMSCFSTNNPITLYNHFITISAGSELKAPNLLPRAD